MSTQMDRPGRFKARPLSWAARQFDTGSIGVNIQFQVLAEWNGADWDDWSTYDVVCWGMFNVIMKTGQPNVTVVKQLFLALGWVGQFSKIAEIDPPDVEVQIVVKEDNYGGKTSFKASWIDPINADPSGSGPASGMSPQDAKQLDGRFGSLLRAVTGAVAKDAGGPPPAGAGTKKAAPPTRQRQQQAPPPDDAPPLTDEDMPH